MFRSFFPRSGRARRLTMLTAALLLAALVAMPAGGVALAQSPPPDTDDVTLVNVKGGDILGHWGGGIVYHRHERLTSVDQTEGRQWRSRNGQRCQRVMRCPGLRELGARRSRGCA